MLCVNKIYSNSSQSPYTSIKLWLQFFFQPSPQAIAFFQPSPQAFVFFQPSPLAFVFFQTSPQAFVLFQPSFSIFLKSQFQ